MKNTEIYEEIIEASIENANKIERFKSTVVNISNINDILYIHTNILDIKNQFICLKINLAFLGDDLKNKSKIVDLEWMT